MGFIIATLQIEGIIPDSQIQLKSLVTNDTELGFLNISYGKWSKPIALPFLIYLQPSEPHIIKNVSIGLTFHITRAIEKIFKFITPCFIHFAEIICFYFISLIV